MYKASRRREYERVKLMDEEVAREKADEEFERNREETRKKDEEKTGKNRKRRDKKKNKGKDGTGEADHDMQEGKPNGKINLGLVALPGSRQEESGDELPVMTAEAVGVIIHDDD